MNRVEEAIWECTLINVRNNDNSSSKLVIVLSSIRWFIGRISLRISKVFQILILLTLLWKSLFLDNFRHKQTSSKMNKIKTVLI